MLIKDNAKKEVKFSTLITGDVFVYSQYPDKPLLVVSTYHSSSNGNIKSVVGLWDGFTKTTPGCDTLVTKVNGHFTIENYE